MMMENKSLIRDMHYTYTAWSDGISNIHAIATAKAIAIDVGVNFDCYKSCTDWSVLSTSHIVRYIGIHIFGWFGGFRSLGDSGCSLSP